MGYREELVGKLKQVAVKAGARGIHYVGEGAAVAIQALEELQEKLAPYDTPYDTMSATPSAEHQEVPPSGLDKQTLAAAELLLDEARAVEERIKGAKLARKPLQVTVEATPEPAKSRLRGRKTTPTATAPKRATARASTEGFKAKRGQKHSHNH